MSSNSRRGRLALMFGAVVLLLAAGGGALWWARQPNLVPGKVPLAPIDAEALRVHVQALAKIDPGELARLLEPSPEIEAFAQRAASGKSGVDAQARAIGAAISARKHSQAFVEWTRVEPRDGP